MKIARPRARCAASSPSSTGARRWTWSRTDAKRRVTDGGTIRYGRPCERPGVGTRLLGGLCGLLAAGAALAVSEAVTALLDGVVSPFFAVGNRLIDQTPRPLKEFAIARLGT